MTDETEAPQESEATVSEPDNISDLFNDDESSEASEEASEEESEKGEKTEEVDEGEKPESKTEESEPPSEEEESVSQQTQAFKKAMEDERRKRQELEERLKQLEPPDEEAPDPVDDPEGYEKYLRGKWEKEQWQKTVNRSRERMIEKHPDYEEKEKHFLFLANQDPELARQMNDDPDPALFAYNKAKESLDAQEKSIEERVIERLRKEGKLVEEAKGNSASKVSDLTSATGAGKNKGEEPIKESNDLEDVFDDLTY